MTKRICAVVSTTALIHNLKEVVNKAKAEGRRVIAVGTTSVRTLESSTNEKGELIAQKNNM